MFVQKFPIPLIRRNPISKLVFHQIETLNFLNHQPYYAFSRSNGQTVKNPTQIVTYVPIRPLKKYLTPLFVQKEYLNKGKITKRIPFWPYMTPFYAIAINNFLTEWSLINTSIASVLFFAGVLIRQSPKKRHQRQIIKLESNQDMSKLYITVHYSTISYLLAKTYPKSYEGFQEWTVFTDEDLKNTEYIPTEADLKTFTPLEIQLKKKQFDDKLVQKILKEHKLSTTLRRFELDTSKTLFKLSNNYLDTIQDHEVLHPQYDIKLNEMLNIPYKYLIVRTEFTNRKKTKPYHFFIDLEDNGDLRYQDYLVAIGANYKISLASETK